MAVSSEMYRVESNQFDYETRRYYDTVTWLAETLNGQMRTPFEYRFDGQELYASDGGALEPVFDDAIRRARYLPAYEQRRRSIEKEEYKDMISMMRGELPNTMVILSDFPPELMGATKDVGGYNVARKQTMMRVLMRTSDGKLKILSQSLDGSNRRALEAVYEYFGLSAHPGELLGQRIHEELEEHEQEFLIDQLTSIYDRSLRAQYGGEWYAGQLNSRRLNTYEFVCQQKDLIKAYLRETEGFSGGIKDSNLAAAIEARFSQGITPLKADFDQFGVVGHMMSMTEMNEAGNNARLLGKTYSGCGVTSEAEPGDISASDQLEELGFGNKANKPGEDQFGSLKFKCPKGHENTRPRGKLLEKCQVCKCDVRCK